MGCLSPVFRNLKLDKLFWQPYNTRCQIFYSYVKQIVNQTNCWPWKKMWSLCVENTPLSSFFYQNCFRFFIGYNWCTLMKILSNLLPGKFDFNFAFSSVFYCSESLHCTVPSEYTVPKIIWISEPFWSGRNSIFPAFDYFLELYTVLFLRGFRDHESTLSYSSFC